MLYYEFLKKIDLNRRVRRSVDLRLNVVIYEVWFESFGRCIDFFFIRLNKFYLNLIIYKIFYVFKIIVIDELFIICRKFYL